MMSSESVGLTTVTVDVGKSNGFSKWLPVGYKTRLPWFLFGWLPPRSPPQLVKWALPILVRFSSESCLSCLTMLCIFAFASFLALPFRLIHAAAVPLHFDDQNHVQRISESDTSWYHSSDHPAHALFRRQSDPSDGVTYATVGSPQWLNGYPATADTSKLPQAWVDALETAVSAGKIPNIPQSRLGAGGITVYPNGLKPDSPQVCSGTYQCQIPGDIWSAPAGYLGCGFDDGPLPVSP